MWPRDDQRHATNPGIALAAQGKSDEAFCVLSRAGGPAAAHAKLGYVLVATGRRDEAYRKALAQLSKPDRALPAWRRCQLTWLSPAPRCRLDR